MLQLQMGSKQNFFTVISVPTTLRLIAEYQLRTRCEPITDPTVVARAYDQSPPLIGACYNSDVKEVCFGYDFCFGFVACCFPFRIRRQQLSSAQSETYD